MPERVAVVTDSTACLPAALSTAHGIEVVPLHVLVDGVSYVDGSDDLVAPLTAALHDRRSVTTSRPAPDAFAAAYGSAADKGATAVVSVHLSSAVSGTVESAHLAAREARVPVWVVDSRSLGMGLGFAALTAAERARDGAPAAEVAAAAADRAARASEWFCLDTLDHLRRGGRMGAAQAVLGSALAVKPLLRLRDGRVEPLEKVRTRERAVGRLEDLAVAGAATAGDRVVDVAVHHLHAEERARALAAALRRRLPGLGDLHVVEVGAVVAAHVGPGMLAVVVAPR